MRELIPIDELRDALVWLIPKLDAHGGCIEGSWDGGSDCLYGAVMLVNKSTENSFIPNEPYQHEPFSQDLLGQQAMRIWGHIRYSLDVYCQRRFGIGSSGPPYWKGSIRLEVTENNAIVCEVRTYNHYTEDDTYHHLKYREGSWREFSDDDRFILTELLPNEPLELKDCGLCSEILKDLGLESAEFYAEFRFADTLMEHNIRLYGPLSSKEREQEIMQKLSERVLQLLSNAYSERLENTHINISGSLQGGGLLLTELSIEALVVYTDLSVGDKVPLFIDGVWYDPTVSNSDLIRCL